MWRSACGYSFPFVPARYLRKEELEQAVITEVRRLFGTWADTKRVLELINAELRMRYEQQSAEASEAAQALKQTDEATANLRKAIVEGLDDIEWANQELRRLKAEKERLLARATELEAEIEIPQFDLDEVAQYQERFTTVLAQGNALQKAEAIRAFVGRVDVDPRTGRVTIHLFGSPPVLTTANRKGRKADLPPTKMVAGACYVVYHDAPS